MLNGVKRACSRRRLASQSALRITASVVLLLHFPGIFKISIMQWKHIFDIAIRKKGETADAREAKIFDDFNVFTRLYLLEPRIGGVEQTQTSNKPKLRTNSNFAQTQTSNKPKLRTNLNFAQTQTSNKLKLQTNPKVSG